MTTTIARSGERIAFTPSATALQRVDVEARVGLVEHRQLRLEHRHLEDLVALLFAAGEALVHRRGSAALGSICSIFAFSLTSCHEFHGVELGLARDACACALSAALRK